MSNRTIFYLTFVVILGILTMFVINALSLFNATRAKEYLSPNHVRGMAVVYKGVPYTLNFEQQNKMIELFNHSTPIEVQPLTKNQMNPDFEKIIVYQFNAPDLEIHPVAYLKKPSHSKEGEEAFLVFSSSTWNPKGLLQETTPNGFMTLIPETYDH